jgi:FtsP/CotA-like multicopper oxidase with cupredoxin domain
LSLAVTTHSFALVTTPWLMTTSQLPFPACHQSDLLYSSISFHFIEGTAKNMWLSGSQSWAKNMKLSNYLENRAVLNTGMPWNWHPVGMSRQVEDGERTT